MIPVPLMMPLYQTNRFVTNMSAEPDSVPDFNVKLSTTVFEDTVAVPPSTTNAAVPEVAPERKPIVPANEVVPVKRAP